MWLKRAAQQLVVFVSIPVISVIAVMPQKVSAASVVFCELNAVLYSACADVCAPGSTSSSSSTVSSSGDLGDATPSDGLTAEQAAFVDRYHEIAEQLSIEYGIPWEAVMAQGILESGAGTSEFARERNNFFGIGAFDSNPNNAYSFATPEEGWRGYYQNIVDTATYRNHGVFRDPNITDPYAYTRAIKAAGYATDPEYVEKVSKFIRAIEIRAKEKGWKSSAELAKENPEMLSNAAKNAEGGSDGPSVGTPGGSSGSSSANNCPARSTNKGILEGDCAEMVSIFREKIASGELITNQPDQLENDLNNCGNESDCHNGVHPDLLRAIIALQENTGRGEPMYLWALNDGHFCDGLNHTKGKAVDIPCEPGASADHANSFERCKEMIDYLIANRDQLRLNATERPIWQQGYRCGEEVNCHTGGHHDHIHMSIQGGDSGHSH